MKLTKHYLQWEREVTAQEYNYQFKTFNDLIKWGFNLK